jgi:signal peptidase
MTTCARRLRSAMTIVALLAGAGLAAVMIVPAFAGYERYVITSGSMTGTYDTGSVVYAKPVPTASLRTGDVITYAPPAGESATKLVTHRIFSITPGPKGERVFRTKGDANQSADPWTFALSSATQAKVSAGIPYVGHVFTALAARNVRMLIIGLPALLVAISVLAGLVRDARAGARAEEAAAAVPATPGAAPPRP